MAIESSDITLISGALSGLVTAIDLSRATMRNIRQNLVFAFIYNGLGIPIAAGEIGRDEKKEEVLRDRTPTVTDPVCGMGLDPAAAVGNFEHEGHTYYFCSQHCAESFAANPGTYVFVPTAK